MPVASLALDINKPNLHFENGKELENKTYLERKGKRQINLNKIEPQELRLFFLTETFAFPSQE